MHCCTNSARGDSTASTAAPSAPNSRGVPSGPVPSACVAVGLRAPESAVDAESGEEVEASVSEPAACRTRQPSAQRGAARCCRAATHQHCSVLCPNRIRPHYAAKRQPSLPTPPCTTRASCCPRHTASPHWRAKPLPHALAKNLLPLLHLPHVLQVRGHRLHHPCLRHRLLPHVPTKGGTAAGERSGGCRRQLQHLRARARRRCAVLINGLPRAAAHGDAALGEHGMPSSGWRACTGRRAAPATTGAAAVAAITAAPRLLPACRAARAWSRQHARGRAAECWGARNGRRLQGNCRGQHALRARGRGQ